MNIEVSLSPALYPYRTLQSHHTTVAIDVLRATTSICAAFQAGCSEVVPLDSLEPLASFRANGYALAAERGGRHVGDAEYGNSPTEYLRHDLTGVRLAYSTTNGTRAILRGADADCTYVGAFANLSALAAQLLGDGRDVVLLCSGWENDFSLEDTLMAGGLIDTLCKADGRVCAKGDAAVMALTLATSGAADSLLSRASHVARLQGFGAQADIEFAMRRDTCPVVPMLRDGRLVLQR